MTARPNNGSFATGNRVRIKKFVRFQRKSVSFSRVLYVPPRRDIAVFFLEDFDGEDHELRVVEV